MKEKILGLLTICNIACFLFGLAVIFHGEVFKGLFIMVINGIGICINGSSVPSLFKEKSNETNV